MTITITHKKNGELTADSVKSLAALVDTSAAGIGIAEHSVRTAVLSQFADVTAAYGQFHDDVVTILDAVQPGCLNGTAITDGKTQDVLKKIAADKETPAAIAEQLSTLYGVGSKYQSKFSRGCAVARFSAIMLDAGIDPVATFRTAHADTDTTIGIANYAKWLRAYVAGSGKGLKVLHSKVTSDTTLTDTGALPTSGASDSKAPTTFVPKLTDSRYKGATRMAQSIVVKCPIDIVDAVSELTPAELVAVADAMMAQAWLAENGKNIPMPKVHSA